MGGLFSCCDESQEYRRHADERQPLRSAAMREENEALLAPILEKREAAVLKGGSAREAYAFAQSLIDLVGESPELFKSLENRDRLLTDAIKYLDFAIQAEAAFGENRMRESMYLARAELLWMLDKVEDSFREYMGCLKESINERVIESWFPKLSQLGRENEIDKICKQTYPRAKNKEQQELLLRAFYQYTTLSTKAAYEWADPQEVDRFVEQEKSQGRGRTTLRRRTGNNHDVEATNQGDFDDKPLGSDGDGHLVASDYNSEMQRAAEEQRRKERLSAPPPLLVPPSGLAS